MTVKELFARLEEFAPKRLSDEYCRAYGAYDNSGVLLDCGTPVDKVLFSLDFSAKSLAAAKKAGAQAVVTHHPAIYEKIGAIGVDTPAERNLLNAVKSGISVISMHLNFDCAAGGIDEWLMRAAGYTGGPVAIMEPLQGGLGYGRVYDVKERTASRLCEDLKNTLKSERVLCYGGDKKVLRAASFCGAGACEEAVRFAAENGADCVISSDFKHHVVAAAAERGLSVIAPTHYAAENYGFEKIYLKIKENLGVESEYFCDGELL